MINHTSEDLRPAGYALLDQDALPRTVTLSPGTLRRVARYQARLEGSLAAFQAVQNAVTVAQQAMRECLAEVLGEEGVDVASLGQDAQLNIDWRTGVVTLP